MAWLTLLMVQITEGWSINHKLRATDEAPRRITRHTLKVLSMNVQMNLLPDNIVASTGKAFFCGFSPKECSPTGRIAIMLSFLTHLHLGTLP